MIFARPGRVVTLGEVLLRLSSPGFSRLTQARSLEVNYAGAEANVSSSLARMGMDTAHITAVPDNDIGMAAAEQLRSHGIDASYVRFQQGRMGLYYLEQGAMQRASRVVYDRYDSVFCSVAPGMWNWSEIFLDAAWFHYTGITPAISPGAARVCEEAVLTAREMGVTVSGDINFRSNLWRYGKNARDVMPNLIANSDLIVAGPEDILKCTGIEYNSFQDAAAALCEKFPEVKIVAGTVRKTVNSSHEILSGRLWDGTVYSTRQYDLTHMVDRIGAGDAFMAGLIYGLMNDKTNADALEFATAAGVLKHSIPGDVNLATVEEIEQIVQGTELGRLRR